MVFPTFIPFYEDEYKLKLRKLSDRALNGAYRQLKTRMASAVTGGDDVGVFLATHKVGLAVHRRRIGVRDQKLDMIKDEFHRRCLSVPSMRLWDIASGFGRGKITAGFESAGGFHNGVDDENVMRTDDYDDDYYHADYYGEDDYYDDYYDDGGYKYYEFSHSNLSSNYLYCPTREDYGEDYGRHHKDSYQGRRNQDEYKERSGSPSDSHRHYRSHSSSHSSVSGQSNHSRRGG